jgi:hypothetical protein
LSLDAPFSMLFWLSFLQETRANLPAGLQIFLQTSLAMFAKTMATIQAGSHKSFLFFLPQHQHHDQWLAQADGDHFLY